MKAYNVKSSRGAVVLTAVILLLVLATLVTLYTGRVKSFESQITLNTQNRMLAFNVAEAGLMRALGTLGEDPQWDGVAVNEALPNGGNFTVSGAWQDIFRADDLLNLVTMQSTGTSPDGLSTVTVREQGLRYSILANPPDVPLIVAGGLNVGGNFEVVANPNGGGEGVPLSIWTDQDVDMNNGSGTTCGLQEFNDGNCSSSPYSEKGFQDLDILDNDPAFPDDLLAYLFNVPEAEWQNLRDDAEERLTNCDTLGVDSEGLIWVDGDCQLNAGTVVGSATSPVILIVSDGDLTMNGGAEIFGLVMSFRKPGVVLDFEINMLGGARVNGVVVSNHPVGHANGTYNSVYDADVLALLQVDARNRRIGRVPGSWRDF